MSFNNYREQCLSEDETDLETTNRALTDPFSLKLIDEAPVGYETDDVEETLPVTKSSGPTSPMFPAADVSMSGHEASETESEITLAARSIIASPTRKRKRPRLEAPLSLCLHDYDSDADDDEECDRATSFAYGDAGADSSRRSERSRRSKSKRKINSLPVTAAANSLYGDIGIGRARTPPCVVARKVTVSKITLGIQTLGRDASSKGKGADSSSAADTYEASSPSDSTDTSSHDQDMLSTHPSLPIASSSTRLIQCRPARPKRERRKARAQIRTRSYNAISDPCIEVKVVQTTEGDVPASVSMESVHEETPVTEEPDAPGEVSRVVKKARTRYRPTKPLLSREIQLSGDEAEPAGHSVRNVRSAAPPSTAFIAAPIPTVSVPHAPVPTVYIPPARIPAPTPREQLMSHRGLFLEPEITFSFQDAQAERQNRTPGDLRRLRASHTQVRETSAGLKRHDKQAQHTMVGHKFTSLSHARREARVARRTKVAWAAEVTRHLWEPRIGNWCYCDVVRAESWTDWPWVVRRKFTANDARLPEFRISEPEPVVAASSVEEVEQLIPAIPTRPAPCDDESEERPAQRRRLPVPAAITALHTQASLRRARRTELRRVREEATRRRLEQEGAERLAREVEVRQLAALAEEIERNCRAIMAAQRRPVSPPPAYVAPETVPILAPRPRRLRVPVPGYQDWYRPGPQSPRLAPPPPYNAQTDRTHFSEFDMVEAIIPTMVGGWPGQLMVEADEVEIEVRERSVTPVPNPFEMDFVLHANGWEAALDLEEGEWALEPEPVPANANERFDEVDEVAAAGLVAAMEDREYEEERRQREQESQNQAGLLGRVRGWLRW